MEYRTDTFTGTSLDKLVTTSYALLDITRKLQSPESLPVIPTIDNTVEVARKTLRWLRNLQNLSQNMENWLKIGNLPEQQIKTQWLEKLIIIYAGQVKIAQLSNPDLLNHFTIDHANHAAGSIAVSIALHTLESLPDNSSHIIPLDDNLEDIPEQWDNRQGHAVEHLIDAIESGLTHLVNKPLGDRSPIDRLIEVSKNIQAAVMQLYSIDTLEDPARVESIELAREILRRLRNMTFSDKDIKDAIDTGRPNEKLAFAQRIAEMVGMYTNLLSEAMRTNPDIMDDERVQNANEAAVSCSQGIKLLAAKEIPNEANSLKNISVDLEKIGGGKEFESGSLNKLMSKMEGGLEQAAEEVISNKKQFQKTAVEIEAAAQAERVLRRRRRRHHHQAAIAGHNAAQMANLSIQHETVMASVKGDKNTVGVLNKGDIDAVLQAGSSLRKNNKQANDMLSSNPIVEKTKNIFGKASAVSVGSKISQDNKGFSGRERDQLNNPRNRPRIG
ncbi:MAG: hypothetical protein ABL857_01980 [Rickettsiales bacterium]|jgi:hypothetical protein